MKGTNAIAGLPFTSLSAVTKANLRYASTGSGTIEIRTASSSGSLFGQPEAYSAGGATNGDRGTLLAKIPVSGTGGLGTFQTTNLSGNILSNTGSTGGSVTGNYMIVVVFKGENANSTLHLNELRFQ
ncbi:hypothetical protein ACFVQB_19315 [Paenibacillus sp. NPDC057886]|uniref:hypothetical protein n=1 Tax=Paenibacillus sp. NPDC057886 TaxID=3346270 RepID=UPI0036BDCE09